MTKTILLTASLALALSACHGGRHRDPERAAKYATEHVSDMLDDLDATDAQRARVQAATKGVIADAVAIAKEHRETRTVLIEEWTAERSDAARLHALVDERAARVTALLHKAADAFVEIHDTLSPAQRSELAGELHLQKD